MESIWTTIKQRSKHHWIAIARLFYRYWKQRENHSTTIGQPLEHHWEAMVTSRENHETTIENHCQLLENIGKSIDGLWYSLKTWCNIVSIMLTISWKPLNNHWTTIEQPLETQWQTNPRPSDNHRNIMRTPLINYWNTMKTIRSNQWKRLDNMQNHRTIHRTLIETTRENHWKSSDRYCTSIEISVNIHCIITKTHH